MPSSHSDPTIGSSGWGTPLNAELDRLSNRIEQLAINAKDWGATGDGVADDTSFINAALTAAASAGGGTVYLPTGIYKTTGAIVIPGDNTVLRGATGQAGNVNATRWGASIIKPASGALYDAVRTPLPPTPGTAGFVWYGVGIRDLVVDCSNMTGTTTGQGNGVHFYGVRYGHLERVQVYNSPNWGILLEGDNPTNFAYNTSLRECIIGGCAGGIRLTSSEQCDLYRCIVEGLTGAATAATQPYSGTSTGTTGYMVYANVGWTTITKCTFGNVGTYTNDAVFIDNGISCEVNDCLFDHVKGVAIHTTSNGHIFANNRINNPCQSVTAAAVQLGAGSHMVMGNVFQASSPHYTYAIAENGAYVGNVIADNVVVAGTTGAISVNSGSTSVQVSGNSGYNPVGPLTAPGIPASGTPQTNTFGAEAEVYVTGGTVSAIAIGGTATGATLATGATAVFRVAAGQTITLTYTVAPTWKWFGY